MLEEKFSAFREEVQALGQAKVQALRELAGSLECIAPRCCPQIQVHWSRIEATWEKLDRAIKARTEVEATGQGGPRGGAICAFRVGQDPAGPPGGVCTCVCVPMCVSVQEGGCL